MIGRKLISYFETLALCAICYSGLSLGQCPLRAQTTPVYPTDQVTKGKKAKVPAADVTGTSPHAATEAGAQKAKAMMPVKNASEADIQAAKASGKVWVNTDSSVYHKGGKWYGATKQGKFMTEQEAVKAGYRPAKNEGK